MLSVFRASRTEAGGRRWCESQAPVEQDDVPSAALAAASPSPAQSSCCLLGAEPLSTSYPWQTSNLCTVAAKMMRKQGATFQLGEKHITRKYSLHFLFFLHHLQLFTKLWPKKQSCWTKLRKKRGCQASLTPSMQDTGLLMIHGKRTIILPAASHVINQLHRQLAAFSRSSTRRSHSHTEFSVTSPHWKRDIWNSDLDPLALRKHDWGGSALLDKPGWVPG